MLDAQTHVQDFEKHPSYKYELVNQACYWVLLKSSTDCLLLQGPDPVDELPEHQPTQFDICIANILKGPLQDLQPRLSGYVKPGGQLLLSGILTSQVIIEKVVML